jgi:hypothetical protein
MAEETSKSRDGHRQTSARALEHEKETWLRSPLGPLDAQVVAEDPLEHATERQHAVATALSANAEAAIAPNDVGDVELEDLTRAESAEKHQMNERDIAISRERAKEDAAL